MNPIEDAVVIRKIALPNPMTGWAAQHGLKGLSLHASNVALALTAKLDRSCEAKHLKARLDHLVGVVRVASQLADCPWPLVILLEVPDDAAFDVVVCLAQDANWHRGELSLYATPVRAGGGWLGPTTIGQLQDLLLDQSVIPNDLGVTRRDLRQLLGELRSDNPLAERLAAERERRGEELEYAKDDVVRVVDGWLADRRSP